MTADRLFLQRRPRQGVEPRRLLTLAIALFVAGCAAPTGGTGAGPGGVDARQVTVQMTEFSFEPATITVKANEQVRLTVHNGGSVDHNWTMLGLDGEKTAKAQPGQSTTVAFSASRPGTYRVVCTEPGHEAAGMVGSLVVE